MVYTKVLSHFKIFCIFTLAGILYVYAIGPYVTYYQLQWACLIIPIVFAIAFFFMPESPHFLLAKGRKDEAAVTIKFLRGKNDIAVQEEVSYLQKSIQESLEKNGSYIDIFRNKASTKALIISVGLLAFQQLSGINAVLFYSTDIFLKASGNNGGGLDPNVSTILVGAVMVMASGVTPFVVDKLGRKIILLFSAAGMAISLVRTIIKVIEPK